MDMDGFKAFTCAETVQAKPMTRQQFVDFTGNVPRESYNPYAEGFAVYNPNMQVGEQYYWLPVLNFIKGHTEVSDATS